MLKNIFIAAAGVMLLSCSRTPEIPGFDNRAWKQDIRACQGNRVELSGILIQHKEKIKGIHTDKMVELLGNPDQGDFHKRGRKTYSWFIESGSQCAGQTGKEGRKLKIEMNALDFVSIVIIQD